MKDVVSEFPENQRASLKPALDNWRMPFWDWALPRKDSTVLFVPELLSMNTVEVRRPTGLTETIDNPLYRYKFPLNNQQRIDGVTDIQLGPREIAPVCLPSVCDSCGHVDSRLVRSDTIYA